MLQNTKDNLPTFIKVTNFPEAIPVSITVGQIRSSTLHLNLKLTYHPHPLLLKNPASAELKALPNPTAPSEQSGA